MGLDITAYRRLHEVPASEVEVDEDGWPVDYDTYVQFGSLTTLHEDYWPGRAEPYNQTPDAYYAFEDVAGMRAGSYSGYNHWRGLLSRLSAEIAVKLEEPDAFRELILFSDCEGLLGSVVSAKLYDDFASYRDFAEAFAENEINDDEDRDWFLVKYNEWLHMFDMARDEGAVQFH